MKGFFAEFKKFITRGNVLDMAVGMIIGAAFTNIVKSLVDNVISPLIGSFGGASFDSYAVVVNGATLNYGMFITAIINFLLTAFVLFVIIKVVNTASEKAAKLAKKNQEEETPAAPTTKVCPYCKSEINIEASRCPHCTSQQPV